MIRHLFLYFTFTFCLLVVAIVGCGKQKPPIQVEDSGTTVNFDPNLGAPSQPGQPLPDPNTPPSAPPLVLNPGDPAPAGSAEEALINAVLANGESEDSPANEKGGIDRVSIFGNNYPGTSAELGQCVNDAKKNVIGFNRIDSISVKNIRLFLNERCTKVNYEKWSTWAIKDTNLGDKRVPFANSSHGSEDARDGKIIDVLVTWDMVKLGRWDNTTEVSYDFWYNLLRSVDKPWIALNDSCHSGGQTRFSPGSSQRKVRSLTPPADAQARIDNAISRSNSRAMLGQLIAGTVFAACLPNELSEEDARGGAGTRVFWEARTALPALTSISGDIVREQNRRLKADLFTQHCTLIGANTIPFQLKK